MGKMNNEGRSPKITMKDRILQFQGFYKLGRMYGHSRLGSLKIAFQLYFFDDADI